MPVYLIVLGKDLVNCCVAVVLSWNRRDRKHLLGPCESVQCNVTKNYL